MLASLLLSGTVDYAVKYAADHQMVWLSVLAGLLWIPVCLVWYELYQMDKFMVLSVYYMFFATFKNVFISQALVGEKLTIQEALGCLLVICGVIVLAVKGSAKGAI